MKCATHPNIETELACGRCGTPICPRCLVQTPVGARCRKCAGLRRLPTYNVSMTYLLRGAAAAAATGAAMGAAWHFLIRDGRVGIYGALFVALAIGLAVGQAVSVATNHKLGPALQGLAACGVVLAYFVHNLLGGSGLIPINDLYGYVAVGLGIAIAVSRLR
jgi:hypothetical protein